MGKRLLIVCIVICLAVTLPVFSYAFTNEIPISTDSNGSIFNGVGYQQGYRLNSSGSLSVNDNSYVTGFIPVSYGDTVYLEGLTFQFGIDSGDLASSLQMIRFYDSDKNLISDSAYINAANAYNRVYGVYDSNGIYTQFNVSNVDGYDYSDVAFFRLSCSYIGSESVISVGSPIPASHSVSVSSSSGGTASADVSTSYVGQTVTLTATPNTDFYFSHWEVLSGGVTISNNMFTMPDEDVSVIAVFAPIEYDISVSSSSGGIASADLSKAAYGQTVTLTATPSAGYALSEWQVTSGNASVVNNQFIMPRGDVSVKAVFLPSTAYVVTVESAGNGVASANPTTGFVGTAVTLSAVPSLGYEFDRWEVISGSVSIVNDEFILPASDVVIKAHFKPIVYTITLNQGANGSATVSQTTGIIGDIITLTATPDDLYNFSHWNVIEGGISVDGNSFTMPASNVVIQPVFVEQEAVSSGFTWEVASSDFIIDVGLPYTYLSSLSNDDVVIDFGEQPAGEYLVNVYHYGNNYDLNLYLVLDDKYLAFAENSGLSSVGITHDGGPLVITGSMVVNKVNVNTAFNIYGSIYNSNGSISTSYVTATTNLTVADVVLIPYGLTDTQDFGIYSSIVSFLKGQFRELISVFGSQEAEEDVGQAQESLDKEVEELGQLSADLTEQSSNLEQQFNTDFAVPDEVTGSTSCIQAIYNFLFSSLGIFSIFIWLPVVVAVIRKLLRL